MSSLFVGMCPAVSMVAGLWLDGRVMIMSSYYLFYANFDLEQKTKHVLNIFF